MSLDLDSPQQLLDVGHSRLAYWKFGRGPDVVFVHGWPLRAATFRHLVAALADRYTCHLFDLPGAGATEYTRKTPIGIEAHAATVRAAIDRLGLSRYAFVGHDSGGLIARHVAVDDPRVAGLVLGNTEIPGFTPFLLKALVVTARLGLGRAFFRAVMASGVLRRSPLGFGGCFTRAEFVDGEFKTVMIDPLRDPQKLAGQLLLLHNIGPHTVDGLADLHARLTAPVALVWGTDDPWFPLRKARPMVASFGGGASLVEIPRGKLFCHEDHVDEFAAATRASLTKWLA